MQNITYANTSDKPSTANRKVSFSLTDGAGGSSIPTTQTIAITAVNDDASLSSADVTLAETNAPLTTSGTLTITDVDSPATFVAQTNLAGDNGKFSISTAGAWTYTANSAFDSLNVGDSLSDTFDVFAFDGTKTSVKVTIDGTNDAPTIAHALTTKNALQDRAFSLNISNAFQDVDDNVLKYTATLADNSTLPTWLTLNANTGIFSGTPATPDNNLSITVTATDKALASVSSTFALNVLHPITSPTKSAIINGTANDDYLLGTAGNDKLYGKAGHDFLYGGVGNDFLYGDDGDDLLNGGSGNDNLNGGIGNDTYQFDMATIVATHVLNEAVVGGTDTIDFSAMSTPIKIDLNLKDQYATPELHIVIPILSLENVVGGSGNDMISGSKADNIFTGGAGNDEFRFSAGVLIRNITATQAFGRDTIADFTRGEDKISLSKASFNLAGATLSTSDFAVVANDAAVVGVATKIVYSQSSHGLFLNDGIHSGQFAILASNLNTLSVNDFQLVA
jgi:VCBS repeat-containing protein